jgi:uncharacterized RDD family membrane protein YckC
VLIERVGRGGFGDVWKARHHVWPDRIVAVKMPATAERANLLKREGVLQDRVRHPNAVDVLGMDPDHDPPYLIMEFVEGESLRARLQRETRLAPGVAVDLGVQILGALEHAHARGVVHRDLKPENILIAKDGLAKLTDFGLGRLLEDARAKLAVSGSLISTDGRDISGTVAYMAPEQREAGRTVDARADLYAFGIVLFEMLTGARPEGGEAPADLVAGLDPRLDAVFRKCYCRLEKRYHSAAAIIGDLAPLASKQAVVAAVGPSAVPIARLSFPDPKLGGEGVAVLGREPLTLTNIPFGPWRPGGPGPQVAHVDGAWWIVAPSGSPPTFVIPAHVPAGRQPHEVAERVGTAPLKLAQGMRIAIEAVQGKPVACWFHDGRPQDHGEDLSRARVGPDEAGWGAAARIFFIGIGMGLAGGAVYLGAVLESFLPAILLGIAAIVVWGRLGITRTAPADVWKRERAPSPEVFLGGRPAGLLIRGIAFMIDMIVFIYLAKFLKVGAPAAYLLYDFLMTAAFGATVGKYILGLKVVREDGGPVSFAGALVRTLSKLLSALPLWLGFLLAGFTPSKQALHDFFAGSRVIRVSE